MEMNIEIMLSGAHGMETKTVFTSKPEDWGSRFL
jgi:hypothetical protein